MNVNLTNAVYKAVDCLPRAVAAVIAEYAIQRPITWKTPTALNTKEPSTVMNGQTVTVIVGNGCNCCRADQFQSTTTLADGDQEFDIDCQSDREGYACLHILFGETAQLFLLIADRRFWIRTDLANGCIYAASIDNFNNLHYKTVDCPLDSAFLQISVPAKTTAVVRSGISADRPSSFAEAVVVCGRPSIGC